MAKPILIKIKDQKSKLRIMFYYITISEVGTKPVYEPGKKTGLKKVSENHFASGGRSDIINHDRS